MAILSLEECPIDDLGSFGDDIEHDPYTPPENMVTFYYSAISGNDACRGKVKVPNTWTKAAVYRELTRRFPLWEEVRVYEDFDDIIM